MRLTKKFRNIYVYNFDKNCDFEERKERSIETHNKIIDKCGQLEDIEDELGIDLITLFKALEKGIYIKSDASPCPYCCLLRDDLVLVMYDDIYQHEYLPKDYGKTWALTKEELL